LTAATPVPGTAGRVTVGGTALDENPAELAAATTSVADAEKDRAGAVAEAAAVNATLAPGVAAIDTGTETSSS
jgi:hypothetical protein